MINNFLIIDNFLQFEEGTFYKFELLVRNTDGHNELFKEGYSETNKNILIKSWYVDSKDYYEKIKHEMITLSNITGARLYVTLDRKDNVKLCESLIKSYTDSLVAIVNKQNPSIKKLSKIFASETSKVENSSKYTKTLMWDVDTKEEAVKQLLLDYIDFKEEKPWVLDTKKGYHIFCYRKFDHRDWLDWIIQHQLKKKRFKDSIKEGLYAGQIKEKLQEGISVKENELGLVYHPMKGLE